MMDYKDYKTKDKKMIQLASKDLCTGCGACAFVCSKKCISMQENKQGIIYPVFDNLNCITCHACERVCPILNPLKKNEPKHAYASYSLSNDEYKTSASGGIASEIYRFALDKGYYIAGAKMNESFSVDICLSKDEKDLVSFKNSKYVFSSCIKLYPQIKKAIRNEENIVVICLPCQIAALRKVFHDNEHVLYVEVVCHGTTPVKYLREHISNIEKSLNKKTKLLYFRDPRLGTDSFVFTLSDSQNTIFYQKGPYDDFYQYGYHRMITYRENCFHCNFASTSRIADITLSDYKGLGLMSPTSIQSSKKLSSVLVNTKKGEKFISELLANRSIFYEERPIDEPICGDPQLRHPSKKTKARYDFESRMKIYDADFLKSMGEVMNKDLKRRKISMFVRSPFRKLKKLLKNISK